MLRKKGIVRKTFFFSSLLILFVAFLSFAVMYFTMPGYYLMQKEKTLQRNLDSLIGQVQAASDGDECAALISAFSRTNNVDILSFDKDDRFLPEMSTPFVNMQEAGNAFYVFDGEQKPAEGSMISIQIRTEHIAQSNGAVPAGDGAQVGNYAIKWLSSAGKNTISLQGTVGGDFVSHLLVNGTLQPIDEAKDVILSLIPYVLAVAIALGLVLSGIYARQISKPILQISDAALRMQNMEPDAVSGIQTNDELGQLSANLDSLYAKLRQNIEQLQSEMENANRLERSKSEMMQSASHELKTPIAALGGMIEGMIDNIGAYKDKEKYLLECKGQVDKLSRLVAEILGASKADTAENGLSVSEFSLDELVEQAIADNTILIDEHAFELRKELPFTLVATDYALLYRAISNLIANAVRYTPPGGGIRVAITGEDDTRQLSIANDCEPIPADELPKLFEPFYTRSFSRDKATSGTGLGLYIVRRSLERLGIPYEAVNTERGLQMNLFFPAS